MDEKKTADALVILHRRYYAGKPERLAALKQARAEDKAQIETLFAQQPELDSQSDTIAWVGDLEAGSLEIRQHVNEALERSAQTLRGNDADP